MNLEDICVSLELAKQLKEADYPQDDSLFYWHECRETGEGIIKDFETTEIWKKNFEELPRMIIGTPRKHYINSAFAAPTVAELGEMIGKLGGTWLEDYGWTWNLSNNVLNPLTQHTRKEKTEADARAKIWLYLKQEGLL